MQLEAARYEEGKEEEGEKEDWFRVRESYMYRRVGRSGLQKRRVSGSFVCAYVCVSCSSR